jgi:hypothetical protein
MVLVLALLLPAEARAWEVREVLVAEEAHLLRNPAYDILVVTVLAVEDEGATNESPPKVRLRVEEVIRGEEREATVMATWHAPVFPKDSLESGGVTKAWKTRPLEGPEIGAKLIVFSIGPTDSAGVQAWYVYRFSPYNRDVALEHGATERSGKMQIILYLLTLALAVLSVSLYVWSSSKRISQRAGKGLRRAVPALALLTLGVYVFYESGVSAYTDIRIDVLLIWPAIGAALVVGFRSLFQLKEKFGADKAVRRVGIGLMFLMAFLLLVVLIGGVYFAVRLG